MSSSLRGLLPYNHLSEEHFGTVQTRVNNDDKRCVISALGGDNAILALIVQLAFKRTADFIRNNNLQIYDSANHARILDFIRNGTDPRATGEAPAYSNTTGSADNQPTSPSDASNPSTHGQGTTRGERREVIKKRVEVLKGKAG